MFRYTKAECCICDFASTVSNLISLIFTASHGQSLVVCNDFSYKSKVVLLPRLVAASRRTTIRPQFFQIFRTVRHIIHAAGLSPFRTPNLRVAKRKLGVRVDSVPLKTGLAMFALVPHCQCFYGCLNPCRIHSMDLCPNHVAPRFCVPLAHRLCACASLLTQRPKEI